MDTKFLPFEQVKVYDKWTAAPIGRVLQISAETINDGVKSIIPFFGLRTGGVPSPLDKLAWVVGLSGDHRGMMFSVNNIGEGPSLDVTELVEIGIDKAVPVLHEFKPADIGLVFRIDGEFAVKSFPTRGVDCYFEVSGSYLGKSAPAPSFPAVSAGMVSLRWKRDAVDA